MPRPAIFISAVSGELKSARQLVANTLHFLGYEGVWQEVFGTEQGDLREMLRRKIDDCAGLIQLVGQRYGFEPPAPDAEFGRVSYTQFEALYAQQRGKKVWYLFLEDGFPVDPCDPESEEKRQLQVAYQARVKAEGQLRHKIASDTALEAIVLKLRDDLSQLRRRGRQWAALVLALLVLLGLGMVWLHHVQRHTEQVVSEAKKSITQSDEKMDSVLQRYKQMEQALIKLADAEMHAKQLGEKLTPEQLRQRAYTILENELGLAAGTLAKELPAFALELYQRPDTTLLMKARAAYALNKFQEAEQLFLQSDAQDQKALENAQAVTEKLRKQRLKALKGAGQSAAAQIQFARALEHFRAAAALTSENRDPLEWAPFQWAIAYILADNGQYHDAEISYRKVLAVYQRDLGPEHRDTLMIWMNLASALDDQGKYADAEKEYRAVLAVQQRVLGLEHPDTLSSRTGLANSLDGQGKYADAEKEDRAVLAIQERVLGPEQPDTLRCRMNLANSLASQGKYADAEKEYRAVLAMQEHALGPEHPDALRSRNNLAHMLDDHGKHPEAEKEYRTVLAVRERVLGPEHPDTLVTRMNLANALLRQGKYADAEAEFRAVLDIQERVLGPEHPDTLTSRMGLANAHYSQRNYADAEREYRAVLAIRERILGPEHPDTLQSRMNLASALHGGGKYADAEKEYSAVLDIQERVLGPDHPRTLMTRTGLATTLEHQGKHADAEKEYRAALAIREHVLGPDHPDTLNTKNSIGWLLVEQAKYREAEELIQPVIAMMSHVLGPESPILIGTRDTFGEALRGQGKLKEAEVEHRAVLALGERVLGSEASNVLYSSYHLALTLEAEKDFPEALALAKGAETGFMKSSGAESKDTKDAIALRQRLETEIPRQPPATAGQ